MKTPLRSLVSGLTLFIAAIAFTACDPIIDPWFESVNCTHAAGIENVDPDTAEIVCNFSEIEKYPLDGFSIQMELYDLLREELVPGTTSSWNRTTGVARLTLSMSLN